MNDNEINRGNNGINTEENCGPGAYYYSEPVDEYYQLKTHHITSGDFKYVLNEDGTATIMGYNAAGNNDLIIPENLDGHTVTTIGWFAELSQCPNEPNNKSSITEENRRSREIALKFGIDFYAAVSPKSVVIPACVKRIYDSAFACCQLFETVVIKGDNVFIDEGAFSCCCSLASIEITGNNVNISDAAFERCFSLKSITLSGKGTIVGSSAFIFCKSLETVNLQGVKEIGRWAFSGCDSLASVVIPAETMKVTTNPFQHCPKLTDIKVNEANPYLEFSDGALIEKDSLRLVSVTSLKDTVSYTVPNGIKTIGSRVFNDADALKHITIPNTVECIEDGAFMHCGLTEIYDWGSEEDRKTAFDSVPMGGGFIGYYIIEFCADATASVEPGSYADRYFSERRHADGK